ncbi:cytochrome c oxidase subunit II [Danxiaibacter flavus]|uniref:Cytochrome c oxidase subunit 2 n=1 Tax=Danxiaibacter flavus TaxID=3049108 RepID=A0ABV3ZGL9_9BACT|nr:cytochrome c oxidase subunit II [Chitinophagaceae bacterium DXS]
MSMFFTIAVIVLVFLIIFQIAKASEYVSVLKGEEKSRKQQNKVNGFLMVGFLVLGLIGVYVCNKMLYGKTLLPHGSASVQGEKVDSMLWVTLIVTGVVFIITQIILFWFAYKYQENDKRKAFYFPHNNTMEVVWTVIPAIALTVLVVIGLRNWFAFTSDAPKNALQVEVTGKQFGWIFRYAGKDKEFGKKYFRNIDEANSNLLGQIWDDSKNFDDVVVTQTMYIVKDKPVKLIIGSRDVVHDVGLPHFRLKMDAVPGTPTTLWFTPKYTTKEMKEKTGNPNFQYEISCDQMCGNGHYSMKGIIEVVTQAEFDLWMAKQKPNYYAAFPDKDPANQQPATPAAKDSASTAKAPAATEKVKM